MVVAVVLVVASLNALTKAVVRQRMKYLCVVQDGWRRFEGDWLEIIPL